jgi:hypothetical protein
VCVIGLGVSRDEAAGSMTYIPAELALRVFSVCFSVASWGLDPRVWAVKQKEEEEEEEVEEWYI